MAFVDAKAVPITIITGFLGAGKTTLLNRILNGEHGLRVAVLVNDFGAINIDADLVLGVKDNVLSLSNGCICCTIRDDLVATILEVTKRPEGPEYILLEASGVADPSGIAMTFVDDALRDWLRLDSITCTVDADQFFAHPELTELKLRQIAFADIMILNKVDLAGSEQVKRVRDWIEDRFQRLCVVETEHCNVPLEILLSVGRFDPSSWTHAAPLLEYTDCNGLNCRNELHNHSHQHDHIKAFGTWSYETDRPLSLETLRRVARKLPVNIYRAKGIIYASDTPHRRAILQVVGKRVDVSIQDEWGERARRTQIVVIGAGGDIDEKFLEQTFAGCISIGSGPVP